MNNNINNLNYLKLEKNNSKKNNLNLININLDNNNLCISHNGKNFTPEIEWINNSNVNKEPKSYALIIEDPDAPKNFIHWYLPYISPKINKINSLKMENIIKYNKPINNNTISNIEILNGYNSLGEIGYHGPCNPQYNREHRYIFTLYSLDNVMYNDLKIESSTNFENLLSLNNINILGKDKVIYKYKNGGKIEKNNNK
jgi:Raf kinase inhibitor-like YbhB/YbcL family protein